MPQIAFDRFYRYDDLTRLVHDFAEEYPHLARVESIGRSHEGRGIWVVTITNSATGEAREKPTLWADGNSQATEISPYSARHDRAGVIRAEVKLK